MKFLVIAVALLASAAPGVARDLAIPPRNPAVTLTLPDSWKTTEDGTSYKSLSKDGDVFFYVEFADADDLSDLQDSNAAWMKKNGMNTKMKPVESDMDFNGTVGKVQRYNTTSNDGKTIVELITLPASRDRVVMLTLWASQEQRAANSSEIAAILKSVKLPAAGGSVKIAPASQQAKQETKQETKQEAKIEPVIVAASNAPGSASTLADLDSAEQKLDEVWSRLPFSTRHVQFVSRKAANIGDYEGRPDNVFKKGEKLLTYIEPVGFSRKAVGDSFEVNTVVDLEVLSADKKTTLNGQKAFFTHSVKSRGRVRDLFLDITLSLDGAPAGDYVVAYTLHDTTDRTTRIEQPFTIKD
jgi:hypothetical protein